MNISIVGAGYVGLTFAAVLTDFGHKVWVIRRDKEKNEALKNGKIHFFEPGLPKLVKKNLKSGCLIPTIEYKKAIPNSDVVFCCVGTPPKPDGDVDLSQVFKVTKEIGKNLKKGYTLVVNKSTVPPGTTAKFGEAIDEYKEKQADFQIAFCPEFLKEGSAVEDTTHPDRIIIGCESPKAIQILTKLHKGFKAPILVTKVESAELIKYAANSYLALRIVFINQIADLCEKVGADIGEVIKGIGLDKRIGSHYWYPGLGYGGSCFPKDVAALAAFSFQVKENGSLFERMDELNKARIVKILEKIENEFGDLTRRRVTIFGLACKKGTDDVRESPAIKAAQLLKKKGAVIRAYDPKASENAKKVLIGVSFSRNPYGAVKKADILMILTDWPEFAKLNYRKIKNLMRGIYIFDSRDILNKTKIESLGFKYYGIGR